VCLTGALVSDLLLSLNTFIFLQVKFFYIKDTYSVECYKQTFHFLLHKIFSWLSKVYFNCYISYSFIICSHVSVFLVNDVMESLTQVNLSYLILPIRNLKQSTSEEIIFFTYCMARTALVCDTFEDVLSACTYSMLKIIQVCTWKAKQISILNETNMKTILPFLLYFEMKHNNKIAYLIVHVQTSVQLCRQVNMFAFSCEISTMMHILFPFCSVKQFCLKNGYCWDILMLTKARKG